MCMCVCVCVCIVMLSSISPSHGSFVTFCFDVFSSYLHRYLLPIFTHKGEWPEPVKKKAMWFINFCNRCAPGRSGQFEIVRVFVHTCVCVCACVFMYTCVYVL